MKLYDIDFDIKVIYKPKNKKSYFRYINNELVITTPYKSYVNNPENAVLKNKDELYKFIKGCQEKEKRIQNNEKNTMHLFGVEYKYEEIIDEKNFVEINCDKFIVHTTILDNNYIFNIIYNFYHKELVKYINELVPSAYLVFKDYYFLYKHKCPPKIIYTFVKTYYGKCYIKDNVIAINLIMAKYDKYYIKNVLYHEFTHFSINSHSNNFYDLFEAKFPNAKNVQKEMKKIRYEDKY